MDKTLTNGSALFFSLIGITLSPTDKNTIHRWMHLLARLKLHCVSQTNFCGLDPVNFFPLSLLLRTIVKTRGERPLVEHKEKKKGVAVGNYE